jgi:hypothetical protein
MKNNEFIVYRNRDRVATDIHSLSVQLKMLSMVLVG